MNWAGCILVFSLLLASGVGASAAEFEDTVPPFLARHCTGCHGPKVAIAGLNLEGKRASDIEVWEKVLSKLHAGQMPPKGQPQPPADQLAAVTEWLEAEIERHAKATTPDPGRVTARRLNRAEYNNTVRDLLGVDIRPADDFPVDDSGYGFDNIGDVLSISPIHMERYLAAAEKLSRAAIIVDRPVPITEDRFRIEPEQTVRGDLSWPASYEVTYKFPVGGEYRLFVGVTGRRPEGLLRQQLVLSLDSKLIGRRNIGPDIVGRNLEGYLTVPEGRHTIKVAILLDQSGVDDSRGEHPGPNNRRSNIVLDRIEVRGPFNQRPRKLTDAHRKIIACGHNEGDHTGGCARMILGRLMRLAFRRPVGPEEVASFEHFAKMALAEGDSFEESIQVALQAILVSPHFLFRIERDAGPEPHRVTDFELASRLSYFLWSSMPDEELLRLAEQERLRQPEVLEAQVRRMLADPKSHALVENFAGQWLQLRNLADAKPDPKRFPNFDEDLREAMRRETELFFEAVMREDRSILDFIDGRYTHLNEVLAQHYGIEGVEGDEFRRVTLDGEQRSGVLTQASLLTISSYPTRTSPVLRGLWVLENFLGAPPPPPPPNVPTLDEDKVGIGGTLRQQLEQHRADPSCAVCHDRIDPLGFGLENYGPTGAWRTRDGDYPVDAAGELPGGRRFSTPAELKNILKTDAAAFAECLTEKMLTYALGRGLERYDKPVLESISDKVAGNDYRFNTLVLEIVRSMPFQMRRGETGQAKGD